MGGRERDGSSTLLGTLRPFQEGGTAFLLPEGAERGSLRGPKHRAPVFYNPAMALARDLEVALVARLAEMGRPPFRMWEALAASGVRGLRCLRETQGIARLLLTDLQPDAVRTAQASIAQLEDVRAEARVAPADEAPADGPFDWVDVDPYGSPAPFLEAALAALSPKGVLAVTATDMAVLAGPERQACERRYGARPLRTYLCREAGLRIVMGYVERLATARGRHVHPLLSYARDHHVRAYLRIDPAAGVDAPAVRAVPYEGYSGPPIRYGAKGGPLWTGPLHDAEVLGGLRPPQHPARPEEIGGWIQVLQEEARTDLLFYYETGELSSMLGLASPPPLAQIFGTLRAAGKSVGRTPMDPSGWRTDATWEEVRHLFSPRRDADGGVPSGTPST
jgi:tRNA (guanine26-N2/guanine27-N2)-dimethyltransferase